ncbi:baseplate wedge subunit [Serratia phage 92A1]|nr:baseplate wedge subunit [Serratia phage 92A1]
MKRNYKTRGAARVTSRNSDHIDYNLTKRPLIGGKQAIGGVTIRQAVAGTFEPSIQGAVDDLITISELPIGSGMINWTGASPNGQAQVQVLTIAGSVVAEEPSDTNAVVHVYGFPFVVPVNTTPNVLTTTVFNAFKQYVAENKYFQSVTQQSPTSLEVTFIDCQDHEIYSNIENGVTVTSVISSEAIYGYGNWERVGEEAKFGRTLYYFRRIG